MYMMRRKLNSQSGASIVIALIFFLLCLTVGAVVLTAATANVGRVTRIQNQQQAYFAVRSAAELLLNEIKGTSFHRRTETWDKEPAGGTGPGLVNNEPDFQNSAQIASLMTQIKQDANLVFEETKAETHEVKINENGTDPQLPEVTVTWSMKPDYTLIFFIEIPELNSKYPYSMTLTIQPTVKPNDGTYVVDWTRTVSGQDSEGNPTSKTYHYPGTIAYKERWVTWQTGTVTKGGAPIVS